MSDMMTFPETWEEYEKIFGFYDEDGVYYSSNTRLIPSFRVKQWLDHLPSAEPRTKCILEVKFDKEDLEELVSEKVEEMKEMIADTVIHWIPCSERMPEEKKEVLISADGELYIAEYEIDHGKGYWSEVIEYRNITDVDAWMPMPEPWKGEENDT